MDKHDHRKCPNCEACITNLRIEVNRWKARAEALERAIKRDFLEACECCARYYSAVTPCHGEECDGYYNNWEFDEARFKEGAK